MTLTPWTSVVKKQTTSLAYCILSTVAYCILSTVAYCIYIYCRESDSVTLFSTAKVTYDNSSSEIKYIDE